MERGKESVWDYPRPPRIDPTHQRIVVVHGGVTIADSTNALRVLETSHPPTYYIPTADIAMSHLMRNPRRTMCEFKGQARYFDIAAGGKVAAAAAWDYPNPYRGYEQLSEHIAFYSQVLDECYVAGERVDPQQGGYYGGWITSDIVGPFKGGPGTTGW